MMGDAKANDSFNAWYRPLVYGLAAFVALSWPFLSGGWGCVLIGSAMTVDALVRGPNRLAPGVVVGGRISFFIELVAGAIFLLIGAIVLTR